MIGDILGKDIVKQLKRIATALEKIEKNTQCLDITNKTTNVISFTKRKTCDTCRFYKTGACTMCYDYGMWMKKEMPSEE